LTTAGYIFGGFTPIAWDSNSGDKADNTGKSFVFSLKNPRNTEPKIFPLSNASKAIHCSSSCGPIFGSHYDIRVWNDCDQTTQNYTNLGGSYTNDTGIADVQVFTCEYHFQVREIEVFAVLNAF
jgi:hypothetical protein